MARIAFLLLVYLMAAPGWSGYGQTGEFRDRVGHDANYLGYAGVLNMIGANDQPPSIPGVQIADMAGGGMNAAIGILLALFWLPFAASVPLEMELPAVSAQYPPEGSLEPPSLFRSGPFVPTLLLEEESYLDGYIRCEASIWRISASSRATRAVSS